MDSLSASGAKSCGFTSSPLVNGVHARRIPVCARRGADDDATKPPKTRSVLELVYMRLTEGVSGKPHTTMKASNSDRESPIDALDEAGKKLGDSAERGAKRVGNKLSDAVEEGQEAAQEGIDRAADELEDVDSVRDVERKGKKLYDRATDELDDVDDARDVERKGKKLFNRAADEADDVDDPKDVERKGSKLFNRARRSAEDAKDDVKSKARRASSGSDRLSDKVQGAMDEAAPDVDDDPRSRRRSSGVEGPRSARGEDLVDRGRRAADQADRRAGQAVDRVGRELEDVDDAEDLREKGEEYAENLDRRAGRFVDRVGEELEDIDDFDDVKRKRDEFAEEADEAVGDVLDDASETVGEVGREMRSGGDTLSEKLRTAKDDVQEAVLGTRGSRSSASGRGRDGRRSSARRSVDERERSSGYQRFRGENVDVLKERLVLRSIGTDRGLNATRETVREINAMVMALEDQTPTSVPTASLDKLAGRWRLLFTNSIDVLSLGLIPLVSLGQVYQNIGYEARTEAVNVQNVALLTPSLSSVVNRFVGTSELEVRVRARATTEGNQRLNLRFERQQLIPRSFLGMRIQRRLPSIALPLGSLARGYLDVTYLDDDLRVGRGIGDSFFVLLRDEN